MTSTPDHPMLKAALWGVAVCFAIEAGCNLVYGFRAAGGWPATPVSHLNAAGYVAIAVLGALFAHIAAEIWRKGVVWALVAVVLVALSLAAFGFSQAIGWRVLGQAAADGQARRDRAAGKAELAGEQLQLKRDERKKLGTPGDVGTLEQSIAAELNKYLRGARDTVGQVTGNCADPKLAPVTCKAVEGLKTQLASAKRARDLDREIEAAEGKVTGTEALAKGAVDTSLIARLTGATEDDVKTLMPVWQVFLIGLFGHFGWALITLIGQAMEPGRGGRPGTPGGGGGGGGGLHDWAGDPTVTGLHRMPRLTHEGPMALLTAPAAGAVTGGATHHGVTINIGRDGYQMLGDGAGAAGDVAGSPAQRSDGGRAVGAGASAVPRQDLPALPGDAPPVDRSRVSTDLTDEERPVADVVLAFRAACVVDTPGGLVSLDNLYRRYRAWAGDRAIAEPAFAAMFPRLTGVVIADVGGFAHAHGVALRVGAALRAA